MASNRTTDKLSWMQNMRMSYDGVTRQADAWLSSLLNSTSKKYGKYTVFGIVIEAFKQLATLIFTHIAIGAKEHNILTAEQTASVRGLAQLACYKAVSAAEATGKIALVFNSSSPSKLGPTIFIKRGATVKCKENSLTYQIVMDADFRQILLNESSIGTEIPFIVRQGTTKTQQFIADGKPRETFTIDERNSLVSEQSVVVTVTSSEPDAANVIYDKYAGFDEMNRYATGFVTSWSFDGKLQITFGNGITGKQLNENDIVNVEYVACDGYIGNVLVQNAATFELVDGLYDSQTTAISPKDAVSVKQLTDIVGGYNGDDIEMIRGNAGSINRALVLHSAESIHAYMRRYGQYSIIDVWSNTESQTIHVVAVPNIADRYIHAGSILYNYWNLPLSNFVLSQQDIEYLQSVIKADKSYVLLTDIKFETATLSFYQMYVICNKKSDLQDTSDIKSAILDAMASYIEENWNADKLFLSRSAAIAIIEDLDIVESVDIKFIGDEAHIDSIGNIKSNDKYVMPIIRNQEAADINSAVKILVNSTQGYIEI